ncbi:MAG TPA: ABC transporter ATP-binding protein [Candidatus Melainabacteria bacterium]|nr:ABC transporter ATP-binding protein [Candidatus Melainabacteria bacterium]
MPESDTLISLDGVSKCYKAHNINAVKDVSIDIRSGEFVAIMGPSGCGKSTLLNLIGAIDRPDSGSIIFDGQSLTKLDDEELTRVRGEKIGFVFQAFNLLPTFSVMENVMVPIELNKSRAHSAEKRAKELLQRVGLESRANFFPSQLSGGEMQRVAIARALIHEPRLLVADEPTGNLDTQNGENILQLIKDFNRDFKLAIIMATHSREASQTADRLMQMRDGTFV